MEVYQKYDSFVTTYNLKCTLFLTCEIALTSTMRGKIEIQEIQKEIKV